jgi:hypothetical protein
VAKHSGSFTSETAKKAAAKSPQHQPGWKTKATIFRTNHELLAKQKGITPLELYAGMYNDESLPLELRKMAADAAAPYLHRKMPFAVIDLSQDQKVRKSFAAAVMAAVEQEDKGGES